MLRGMWAGIARAVRGVRQPKAVQVGAQTAVSSAQPKDYNLLFPWEFQHGVSWVVVFQLFGAAPDFALKESFGLPV